MDRFNGVATKYLQHYLAWFRYIDSKEYENTSSNKKNMLVKSCLFTVTDTNTASAFCLFLLSGQVYSANSAKIVSREGRLFEKTEMDINSCTIGLTFDYCVDLYTS
jgi:hypothetical protein